MAGRGAEPGAGRQDINAQYNVEDFHLTVPGCFDLVFVESPKSGSGRTYAT